MAQDSPRGTVGDLARCSERAWLDAGTVRVLRCERSFYRQVSTQLNNNDAVSRRALDKSVPGAVQDRVGKLQGCLGVRRCLP